MATVIRLYETGGPENFKVEDIDPGDPGPGEVLLRNHATGLNFFGIYERIGIYPTDLPAVLGMESAGTVERLGAGVNHLKIGDRVTQGSVGSSYASHMHADADQLIRLPDGINFDVAAAMTGKGMTVEYVVTHTHPVEAGDIVLFHAAAGGVGLTACQWLKAIGATVIGTVSSEAKADLARAHGCHHPIVTPHQSFVAKVMDVTGGEGCPVVYDSIGHDTFDDSLKCVRRRGLLVSFGQSSGLVEPHRPNVLAAAGSIFLTRPTMGDYAVTRDELETTAGNVFDMVLSGKVKIEIGQTYPLTEVAQAHRDLGARKTTGSTVLLP